MAPWITPELFQIVSTDKAYRHGSCRREKMRSWSNSAKRDITAASQAMIQGAAGWAGRFRRLARDNERLPAALAGCHFLACVILLRKRFVEMVEVMVQSA